MIKLIHQHSRRVITIYKDEKPLSGYSEKITEAFWKLVEDFPLEKIIWIENGQQNNLNEKALEEVFHHNLIMASCAVCTQFFNEDIGYVDQLPFAKLNRKVLYPTWLMSSDIGGIYASACLKFKDYFQQVSNFDYLLNSIAKLGQHNGLFCYHAPQLAFQREINLEYKAKTQDLFAFAFQFYKKIRGIILFIILVQYQKKYPLKSLISTYWKRNFFNTEIDFSDIVVKSSKPVNIEHTVDVIVPTIGRPKHLLNVLEDLKNQTLLPKKVVVVEQNPDIDSKSDFNFVAEEWPFHINHIFTHQTGACNARNLALQKVTADWVFFCDDDNKFDTNLLEGCFSKIKEYGLEILVTAYRSKSEVLLYKHAKQWGTFGAGNAIIKRALLQNVKFDRALEFGYGEDMDFGMQLRNEGFDIVYHPGIEILHLKAPMGGFRTEIIKPWEEAEQKPKPSPTVMTFILKNYSLPQLRAYKLILWLKFYKIQDIKNPWTYKRQMQQRWERSLAWSKQISKNSI